MKLNFNIGDLFKSLRKRGGKQAGGDTTLAMSELDSSLLDSDLSDPLSEEMLDIGGAGGDGLGADSITSLAAADEPAANAGKKRAIMLLLLLVAAGGGYYAMGGLDLDLDLEQKLKPVYKTLNPVLEMVGLAKPEPATAPAPRPRSRQTKTAAPATKKTATVAAPKKPAAKPVGGTIAGKPFSPDWIEYRRGVLIFRQGRASAPEYEIKLTVPHGEWELPAGKQFASGMFKNTELALVTNNANEEIISKGLDLDLKFEKVTADMLSGSIKLSSKELTAIDLKGSFNAITTGFRTVNGQPVLTGDANETLMYVALKHLLKKEPTKVIGSVGYRDASFKPSKRPRTGRLTMEYATNNKTVSREFTFKKTREGWQVSRMTAEH